MAEYAMCERSQDVVFKLNLSRIHQKTEQQQRKQQQTQQSGKLKGFFDH